MAPVDTSPAPACDAGALSGLVAENTQALTQLQALIARLGDDDYRRPAGADGRHTLGRHVRHIIDHYRVLLAALDTPSGEPGQRLDYAERQRDAALETQRGQALAQLEALARRLPGLARWPAEHPLRLRYSLDDGTAATLASSLARELAFLTSHTVHHMALIALLAEAQGHRLPTLFGVHPSTRRHWRRGAPPPSDLPISDAPMNDAPMSDWPTRAPPVGS